MNQFNTIEEAIAALKAGKCIVALDDPDRENDRYHRKRQLHGIRGQGLDLYAYEP